MSQKFDFVRQWLICQASSRVNHTPARNSLSNTLKRSPSDQGFALPLAMGMGLIMLLTGITMIARSQNDRIAASAQSATGGALGAAETGITRYQALIDSNRVIAEYPACKSLSWDNPSTINCDNTGSDPKTWKNAASIPAINTTSSCSVPGSQSGPAIVSAMATRTWQDVDTNNLGKGQYRLIDYTYKSGTGTLIVEGRVNQVGSGNTATTSAGTSTTRLQVEIPVQVQPNNSIPGLWVQNVPQNMGANKVDGNILISGCPPNNTAPSPNPKNEPPINKEDHVTPGHTVTLSPNAVMPDTPSLPATYTPVTGLVKGNSGKVDTIYSNYNSGVPDNPLPRTGDKAASDGAYHYLIEGNLAPQGGQGIEIKDNNPNPPYRIVLYVQGNIDLSGGPKINPNGTASQMQIYGNTTKSDGTAKYDCKNKGGTNGNSPNAIVCPTATVSLGGNPSMRALIHAPDSVATGNGIGGCSISSPSGFIGAVWVKAWNASTGQSSTFVCPQGNYGSFLATQKLPPIVRAMTTWQRQVAAP
jgi:hypothetical protein